MMNLEQLCALPQAGRALLVAHRWLAHRPDSGATAFGLLMSVSGLSALADELPSTLDAIAADDETAHAMLSVLAALFALDRLAALSKSLGRPINLPAEEVAGESVLDVSEQGDALYEEQALLRAIDEIVNNVAHSIHVADLAAVPSMNWAGGVVHARAESGGQS